MGFSGSTCCAGGEPPCWKTESDIVQVMTEQPIETQTLPNHATLSCYDRSRRLAGDRWQVVLETQVTIPVDQRTLAGEALESGFVEAVREALGHPYRYINRQERTFVAETEKQQVLEAFLAAMRRKAVYFAHPEFPRRCLMKAFHENQRKKGWTNQL
jgi:hypothetical protein